MDSIDEIRTMILALCEKKGWIWKSHIELVVKYSVELAEKLGGDKEVVELAAWLHDIGKLEGKRENHHITGAKRAEEILKNMNYPEETIEKIKHCILTHSTDKNYPPKTMEAKIVASADALSHFDNFLALAHSCAVRGESIDETKQTLSRKYESCWDKLMPEAKIMADAKYNAIKLILGEKQALNKGRL
ncbi:MAG: HD domain-containing protein [Candidatus Aenigmarchaeota archaeon]|nr:HD domain-containing protein [Candidatus Aenigmarchaeota archaeon]